MFTIFLALIASVYGYSVTAQVRNEFLQTLTLVSANIEQGTFTTKPVQSVGVSTDYSPLFVASGDTGVVGTVVYGAQGATNVVVNFFFENNGTQVSTAKVTPPPWIGGVGTPTGTPTDAVFYFWTHEMCTNSLECYGPMH